MLTFKVFSFLLILCVVKSELDFENKCRNDYRNMNNEQIDVSNFCSGNICIEKCCGAGEMFSPSGTCVNTKMMFQKFKRAANVSKDVDYSKINLHSWDGKTKQKSNKGFVFIRNHRDLVNCTSAHSIKNDFFIVEDGSIMMQDTSGSKSWFNIKKLEYCVDFKLTVIDRKPQVKLFVREYNADPEDEDRKSIFILIGLLISSFFLLLVLVVYCLLPKLQNLIGLVLMAYTFSILVTFLIKIVLNLTNQSLTTKHCKIISPMLYFAAISSFFWLNVMSFDVWWSLRGHRKRCEINRRGEREKFLWYCLYAWGTPLLMTAIVTTLDNIDLEHLDVIKPPFDDCFVFEESVRYYFISPIGVIIFVNIILFLLTVYNIWMIKRAVQRCHDSKSSKQDTNRFVTYIKLSVVMGVSWILELIPPNKELWLFILTTAYNLFIGVAIFFLFVFNKRILVMLLKRFNIRNDFTKNLEVSQGTRSGTTGSGSTKTTKFYTRDQSHEMDLLKDCPKEVVHTWNVDSAVIVPIVVTASGLMAKSFNDTLSKARNSRYGVG